MTVTYIDVIALLEGHSSNMKTKWLRRYLKHHFSAANAAMNATGSFHQIGAKIKDVWNHHLDNELKPWHVDRRRSKATWKPNQCAGDNTCYGQIRDIHLSSESTKIMQRHDSDKILQIMVRYAMSFFPNFWLYKSSTDHKPRAADPFRGCAVDLGVICGCKFQFVPLTSLKLQLEVLGRKPVDGGINTRDTAWSNKTWSLKQQHSGGQRSRYTHIITVCHDNVFEWNMWIRQYRKHAIHGRTWKYERSECVRVEIKIFADSTLGSRNTDQV